MSFSPSKLEEKMTLLDGREKLFLKFIIISHTMMHVPELKINLERHALSKNR